MPRLCIDTLGGKEFVSVLFVGGSNRESDWKRRFCTITDEQAQLPLDELKAMFLRGDFPIKPIALDVEVEVAKKKRAELLKRLDAIIKTSNQLGEVGNAKDLWRKLAGKDWPDEV